MRFLIFALLAFGALAGCSDAPPSSCLKLSREPIENPLSFVSYEEAGRSVDEWRRDLTARLGQGLQLPGTVQVSAPVVTGTTTENGQVRTEYKVRSLVDDAAVPFAIVEPAPSVESKDHLALLLHGHGETWDAPFEFDEH